MNILITGASSSFGQAIVNQLSEASDQHTLFLHTSTDKRGKLGVDYLQADLLNEKEVSRMVKSVQKNGGIDVLIHCVSLPTELNDILNKEWRQFERHWQLQVKSFFQLIQHLVPHMKEKKFGRIIGITTEYVVGKPPGKLADYVVAKSALLSLIKCLAVELSLHGITANAISPGMAETTLTDHLPHKLKEMIALQTPTRRLTTPLDVAQLVEFLISSKAEQITGQNLLVNGGYIME